MRVLAEVKLWDLRVGGIVDVDGRIIFEYDAQYIRAGGSISPVYLPLRSGPFEFPALKSMEAFGGLPGVLADRLPDKFGGKLVDAHFIQKGISPSELSPVQKLLYVGKRGMGALEFEPAEKFPNADVAIPVEVATLVQEARNVVRGDITQNMNEIMLSASTAGGMRAKAMVSWNRKTNDVVSGQGPAPTDYEPWIIKFDGTSEDGKPGPYGRMEYAYGLMANAAGLDMMPIELFEEQGRAHFMTLRFDKDGVRKLHTHSLCGLEHADFNQAGAWSYDLYFTATRQLNLGQPALDEAFRRMAFNVITCNRDDHTKNLGFLMVEPGIWKLAPAYDITYAHGANWTAKHQMRVNNKVDGITYSDLREVASREGVKKADEIIEQIDHAVRRWKEFARKAKLSSDWIKKIEGDHKLEAIKRTGTRNKP